MYKVLENPILLAAVNTIKNISHSVPTKCGFTYTYVLVYVCIEQKIKVYKKIFNFRNVCSSTRKSQSRVHDVYAYVKEIILFFISCQNLFKQSLTEEAICVYT